VSNNWHTGKTGKTYHSSDEDLNSHSEMHSSQKDKKEKTLQKKENWKEKRRKTNKKSNSQWFCA
jgi:hypothetical protein